MYYITADPKTNVIDGYNNYQEWQKRNALHSPWGLNETPTYFNGKDKINWEVEYTKNWVKTYPNEYASVLHLYDSIYKKYAPASVSTENPNRTFLLSYVNKVQVRAPMVMAILQEEPIEKNSDLSIESLLKKLKTDPDTFVQQMYENMLMRSPTTDEKEKLLNIIKENPDITPEIIYYSLMTSTEYQYY